MLTAAALLGGVVGYRLALQPQPPTHTISSTIDSSAGLLLYGKCEPGSSTTTCVNGALLTQDYDMWSNSTMVVVEGQPPRCVRGFDQAGHSLRWSRPIPHSAAYKTFVALAAPECKP